MSERIVYFFRYLTWKTKFKASIWSKRCFVLFYFALHSVKLQANATDCDPLWSFVPEGNILSATSWRRSPLKDIQGQTLLERKTLQELSLHTLLFCPNNWEDTSQAHLAVHTLTSINTQTHRTAQTQGPRLKGPILSKNLVHPIFFCQWCVTVQLTRKENY